MAARPDLIILTGEASGDTQGALLIQELLALRPSLRIGAVAGPKMRAFPLMLLGNMEDLQVMGFVDVIRALPQIFRRFFAIKKQILKLNPSAVVCIDYPGFHLRLERSLRKSGYQGKLIHLACPTVWAWGKGRIQQMAQTLDLLLALFPFEPPYFSHTGLRVEYIGHPLTETLAKARPDPTLRARYRLNDKILSLFPGSRPIEIERNLPIQLAAARLIQEQHPLFSIAISLASEALRPQIEQIAPLLPLIPRQETHALMKESSLAIAKSGTVTLELALLNIPTVVEFAIRPLDLFIARRLLRINLPHYCLVNIIANEQVFPELFGPYCTPALIAREALALLSTPSPVHAGMQKVKKLLGTRASSLAAARAILSTLPHMMD